MSECNITCPFTTGDNKYDVLISQLKREINDLIKSETLNNLIYENRLNEMCALIKDNLSNELRLLFDAMKATGELDKIITDTLLHELTQVTYKTDGFISVKQFGAQGNGQCDDTYAIQCAIDSLGENEILLINGGVYLCTSLTI